MSVGSELDGMIIPMNEDGKVAKMNEDKIGENYTLIEGFVYVHNSILEKVLDTIEKWGHDKFVSMSWGNQIGLLSNWVVCIGCGKQGLTDYIEVDNHTFCNKECADGFNLPDEDYVFFAKCIQKDNPILFRKFMVMYEKNMR